MKEVPNVQICFDKNYQLLIHVKVNGVKQSYQVSDRGPHPDIFACDNYESENPHRGYATGYWFGCFDEQGRPCYDLI